MSAREERRVMLTGGCYCGAVRYETDGEPFHETICHCADCRRIVGAASVAWLTVSRSRFRFTGKDPASIRSSASVTRRFCGVCGTSLTYENDAVPDEVDVTTASLDDPDAMAAEGSHPHAAEAAMGCDLRWPAGLLRPSGQMRRSQATPRGTASRPVQNGALAGQARREEAVDGRGHRARSAVAPLGRGSGGRGLSGSTGSPVRQGPRARRRCAARGSRPADAASCSAASPGSLPPRACGRNGAKSRASRAA